jgi:hypothetical protein
MFAALEFVVEVIELARMLVAVVNDHECKPE